MKTPFLFVATQSKNINSFPISGLNFIKSTFNISKNNFESNKTKFINRLEVISEHYGFKYVSSKIVYDGETQENVFEISAPDNLNSDDEDYYYDEIINDMEYFCKNNNMDDLFKNSYIILK